MTKHFDRSLQDFFYHYDWPGNVRELSNLDERLLLTVPGSAITIADLPDEYQLKDGEESVQSEQGSLKEKRSVKFYYKPLLNTERLTKLLST